MQNALTKPYGSSLRFATAIACLFVANTPTLAAECRWAHQPITIDGKVNEPIWRDAGDDQAPVRVLWNRSYLYFALRCEPGQRWILKPSADHDGYYEFEFRDVVPRVHFVAGPNAQPELLETPWLECDAVVRQQDANPSRLWEGRISWKSLMRTGGRPQADETWHGGLLASDQMVDVAKLETLRFRGLRDSPSPLARAAATIKRDRWTSSHVVGSPEPPKPYRVERVWPNINLDNPVSVKHIPGTRKLLLICDRPTRLLLLDDREDATETTKLFEFPGPAYDIAFHPEFAQNGYIFVGGHTSKHPKGPHCQITRYTLSRGDSIQLVPDSSKLILEWDSNGHNGAAVTFGLDGMLYVTTGDGTVRRDTDVVGQRLDTLRAKVLRIDVNRETESTAYAIPPDNPFLDYPGARPETWCYGLRNPWRITTDPKSGRIWLGNNGQDRWEQIYLIARGANYGWSIYEGGHLFIGERERGPTPISKPTFDHHHAEARSLTGGVVYYGDELPNLQTAYLYGDYSTGKIWAAKHDGNQVTWHEEIADTTLAITCFAVDSRGELLIADYRGNGQGGLYRLRRQAAEDSRREFPRWLSKTGIFASTSDHRPAPGVVPYTVNVPGWHDGAEVQRYLALPASKDDPQQPPQVGLTDSNAWRLPEGSVCVQTLSAPPSNNRPARRLETRILTLQQGEWAGYSYIWNEDQSDAQLAPANGAEVTWNENGASSPRRWRVPSRSECMSCHSRAANYLLGVTTLQMNCEFSYPVELLSAETTDSNPRDHQLAVFESLGWFQHNWQSDAAKAWERKQPENETRKEAIRQAPKQRRSNSNAMFFTHPSQRDRLPGIGDDTKPIEQRAMAYLHANCAHCHVLDGGGNARIILRWNTPQADRQLVDVKPMHGLFGMPEAKLVTPGRPDLSVLSYRMQSVGGGRMPRLGSHEVDVEAVRLINAWIESLDAAQKYDDVKSHIANAGESSRSVSELAANVLSTTSAAIAAADLLRDNAIPPERRASWIEAGIASSEPATRDVIEAFLPWSKRVKRLGAAFDPSEVLSRSGNIDRGRRLFEESSTLACRNCHRVAEKGKIVGPDLTQLAADRRTPAVLLDSIQFPSKIIDARYATHSALTDRGTVVQGIVDPASDDKNLVLRQLDGTLRTVPKDSVTQLRKLPTSLMPEMLLKDLTAQEAADLIAFLQSLTGAR